MFTTKSEYLAQRERENRRKVISINPASNDGNRWIENIGTAWRFVGYCDDLDRSIRHKGWFTDREFQDAVMRGVVYQLPSRNGDPVYFVGYSDPDNDDCAYGHVETGIDEYTAANTADSIARRYAEAECDYQDAWRIGQEYGYTFETVETARKTRHDLLAEIKALKEAGLSLPNTPAICASIREKIMDARRKIMAALKKRKQIIDDHYFNQAAREAFIDGACLSESEAKALFN